MDPISSTKTVHNETDFLEESFLKVARIEAEKAVESARSEKGLNWPSELEFCELSPNRRGLASTFHAVANSRLRSNSCPFLNWQEKIKRISLGVILYIFGIITVVIIYNWNSLNEAQREYPALFWLVGVALSLVGVSISLRKLRK